MKYKILLVFTLLFLPTFVKAECYGTDIINERVYVNKIISNLDITTIYEEVNGEVKFGINIANLHPSVYIVEKTKNITFRYGSNPNNVTEAIYLGYSPGTNIKLQIYATNTSCINDLFMKDKSIQFSNYNKFHNDPLCIGISDFYYCKKWVRNDLLYEDFKKEIENIKKDDKVIIKEPDKTKKELIDIILEIGDKYYLIILPSIIFICITLIIVENKKKKDFKF